MADFPLYDEFCDPVRSEDGKPVSVSDSDQIVAIINENTAPAAGGGLDSETIMNMANEHGWNYLDSDAVLAAVLKNLNIANVATLTDINDINNNIITINNKIDSESTKVSSLKTRVYGLVKNNDSDHNRRISFIESRYVKISQFDSERVRTQRLYRYVLGDDLGQPPTDGSTLWQNIYDSDTIITTITKGYNPLAATYDSDLVVATINKNLDIASLSNVSTGAIDSDQVYNMGFEHGWFYDSDRVMTSVGKNFSNIINIINNNLGKVDSDLVFSMLDSEEVLNMFEEHGLAYQTALDSESTEIRLLRADVDALVAGTYNDAPLVARLNGFEADLDSETARIQLLFSNADSDTINIAQLRRDADSDSVVIQSLREQANLDAAYITLIRNDLDSDDHAIQSLSTRLDTVEATDTIQNSRLNSLEARADSDELIVQSIQTQIDNLSVGSGFDSDQIESMINEHVTPFDDSILVARLDSDSIRIQDLQTQINNLVDDTGFDSDQIESMINEHVTPYDDSGIIARLDSDELIVQSLQTQIDVLVAGTYDDSTVVARLDSDELIVQSLQTQIDFLTVRLDSDTTVIQNLQTQLDGFDVADIRARLDSDSIAIQFIRSSVESDYALFNAKIALFNGLTDSDLITG